MHAELELLGGDQLLRVGDSLLQRPGPAVPQPRVAEAVGPQLRRQWDSAAYVRAHEGGSLRRQSHLVDAGSVLEHPQHLPEVRLPARHQVGHELAVLGRRELGDRGVQVIRHPARELGGARRAAPRPAPARPSLARRRTSHVDRTPICAPGTIVLRDLGSPSVGRAAGGPYGGVAWPRRTPLQAASTSLDVLLTDSAVSGTRRFLAPGAIAGVATGRRPAPAQGRGARRRARRRARAGRRRAAPSRRPRRATAASRTRPGSRTGCSAG